MKFCMNCMAQYDDSIKKCPECGFAEGTIPFNSRCIEPGGILADRYIVGMPLVIDSWFVKYIGWDALLNKKTAIYEYSPVRYCARNIGDTSITVLKEKEFYKYMERFVKKAQLLAQLRLPENIAAVSEIFEKNNTSYVICSLGEGMKLGEYIKKNGAVSPKVAESMFMPVLRSIDKLHDSGFVIGGFSPDDFLVREDGSLFLNSYLENTLYNITEDRSDITQKEKQKYFSYERLRETDIPSIAPSCDVYSAALIMHEIMGVKIPEASERDAFFEKKHKDMLKLLGAYHIRIDANKEAALRNASYVDRAYRTHDMDSFIKELLSDKKVNILSKKGPVVPAWAKIAITAVITALIVGGVLFFVMKNRKPEKSDRIIVTTSEISSGLTFVPQLVGHDFEEAVRLLNSSGLFIELRGKEVSGSVKSNTVISQSVSAGTIIEKNSVVGIVLSVPAEIPVNTESDVLTLPDLTLMERSEAEKRLKEYGLGCEINQDYNDYATAGLVCGQEPAAGNPVSKGDTVILTVSKGRMPAVMPDVKGKSRDEAMKELTERGFSPVFVYGEQDKDKADEQVVSQSMESGTEAPKGSSVMISLNSSTELVKVSSLVGLSKDEAADKLSEAGLILSVYTDDTYPSEGYVCAQFPSVGSAVKSGSEITVLLTDEEHASKINISPDNKELSVGDKFVLEIECINIPDLVAVEYELSEEGIIEPVYIDTDTLSMTFKALKEGEVTISITYGGIEKKCKVSVRK